MMPGQRHSPEHMSHPRSSAKSSDDVQAESPPSEGRSPLNKKVVTVDDHDERKAEEDEPTATVKDSEQKQAKRKEDSNDELSEDSYHNEEIVSDVLIAGDVQEENMDDRVQPRLTTSNSGAEIMLGLETDDGKSAEVEIDSLEIDELQPEEIPKGRVRKASIVEKLSKSKESELIALSILESAGQRQREFEKLISEHQELVQEISRTPSAENIVQSEAGRNP